MIFLLILLALIGIKGEARPQYKPYAQKVDCYLDKSKKSKTLKRKTTNLILSELKMAIYSFLFKKDVYLVKLLDMIEKYLNPQNDIAFKRLFCTNKNERHTFISSKRGSKESIIESH